MAHDSHDLCLRQVEGEDLRGKKDQLTLDDLRASLDVMSEQASSNIASALAR